MSQNVTVKIQINDGGTFKDITINADDLANAINTVKGRADDLDKSLVSMASLGQIFDGLSSAVRNLSNYISNLTSDYKSALEAETKLSTAMRNTMDATDEEIQSIKDFCDEQERLGVVAGDVQVSAAQELATYLEFSDSLKTLIPVVNDMTVQQYGLNASAESATQIATMLGKVMNGQTKALSRYGYEFTEAQEAVLLYGNEAQRAAMLAEVVGQSVGGMNYEMAKTPVGIMQQAENRLGKMREKIGAFAIQMEPALKNLSMFTSTTADIVKVAQAIEAAKKSAIGMKASSLAAAVAQKTQAVAARILGVSEYSAVTATKTLKIEMAALEATMTLGVSVAITALISLWGKLKKKHDDVADSIDKVDSATEEFGRVAGDARGQIMLEIGALSDIIEKHKKEKDKVQELNDKYGEAFGKHKTAAEWYDTLMTKSEAYCRQLGYEAKAKLLASQYGEALVNLDDARKQDKEFQGDRTKRQLGIIKDANGKNAGWGWDDVYTKEYEPIARAVEEAEKNVSSLKQSLDECTQAGKAAADAVKLVSGSSSGGNGDQSKLEGLAKDLDDYKKSIQAVVQTNATFNSGQDEMGVKLEAMKSGISSLIGKYGAENAAVRELIIEYGQLLRARGDMGGALPTIDASGLPNMVSSDASSRLSKDINEYRKAVELAVEQNRLLNDGQGETEVRLSAMKSGLTSLIQTYGASDISVQMLIGEFDSLQRSANDTIKSIDKFGDVQETMSAISSSFRSLSDIVGEGAASWLEWGANLLSAIGQAIPAIVMLTQAKKQEANANADALVTGVGASVGSIPFVGPAMALAAIASVVAAISSIPKFAAGGIAYGPTVGMFGEYANAATNPEVVAPLDKLVTLIDGGRGGRELRFRVKGRDLEAIEKKNRRYNMRTNG